jgi:hypothetical protein
MEIASNIKWSAEIEEYLANTAERSYCYGILHKRCEAIYTKRKTYIDLPIIVGSTIAGTLSIGNSSIFGTNNEQLAGMGIGLLSLCVGVLGTINTYFGWAKRAESHRLTSISYLKLFRFIQIELSIPRKERMMCADLMKVVREQYERLQEIAPLVPDNVLDDFKKRFAKPEYEKVAKPAETNGLQQVSIFDEKRLKTSPSFTSATSSVDDDGVVVVAVKDETFVENIRDV